MRFLLSILLILSFGFTDGQQVINAHVRYRGFVSVSNDLLLDLYPGAAAAYSLRKLDKDYTGFAIRVRKDTTGQPEQDIGFLPSGELDTVSLKSFLNARSGFVVTWYNQADSNGVFGVRNATQAVQANQPRIALNGVIERVNGQISLNFNGSSHRLLTTAFSPSDGTYSSFAVAFKTATTDRSIWDADDGTTRVAQFIRTNTVAQTVAFTGGSATVDNSAAISNSVLYLISAHRSTGSLEVFINGSSNGTTSVSGSNNTNTVACAIGARPGSPVSFQYWQGSISEVIHYRSQNTSNRAAIESNINLFYAIY